MGTKRFIKFKYQDKYKTALISQESDLTGWIERIKGNPNYSAVYLVAENANDPFDCIVTAVKHLED